MRIKNSILPHYCDEDYATFEVLNWKNRLKTLDIERFNIGDCFLWKDYNEKIRLFFIGCCLRRNLLFFEARDEDDFTYLMVYHGLEDMPNIIELRLLKKGL